MSNNIFAMAAFDDVVDRELRRLEEQLLRAQGRCRCGAKLYKGERARGRCGPCIRSVDRRLGDVLGLGALGWPDRKVVRFEARS